jgi:hypothetical protein
MSAVANQLNAACREVVPRFGQELMSTFSQNTVLFSKLYKNRKTYSGGVELNNAGNIRETIKYRPLPGGAMVKGRPYNNVSTDFMQPVFFSIKLFQVTVVVNKIDLQVFNRGTDTQIVNLAKETLANGMDSLGKYAEIAAYLPGQGASYSANLNGLSEICNDGSATPAVGSATTAYGGLSRSNSDYGYAVKGKTTTLNGALTHRALLKSLKDVTIDNRGPSFGLTTPDTVVYIEDRFQPQQRFSGNAETDIGIPGWKFHNQTVFETRYAPGNWISAASATSGENRIAYEYVKETSEASGTPLTAYPTVTGETWYWLNTDDRYMRLYVSDHPLWNFGFDDFIGDRNDDDLVGRFHLAAQIAVLDNRRQAEINQIKV